MWKTFEISDYRVFDRICELFSHFVENFEICLIFRSASWGSSSKGV